MQKNNRNLHGSLTTRKSIVTDGDPVAEVRNVNDLLDIARGYVEGTSFVTVSGRNPTVTSLAGLNPQNGAFVFPIVAASIRILAGGNLSDHPGQGGAHLILVLGLDANYDPIFEIIATNGINPSASTIQEFQRINQAFVIDVGSPGASNIGNIDIAFGLTADIALRIPAGIGQSQSAHYTVPRGLHGYVQYLSGNVDAATNKTGSVTFRGILRDFNGYVPVNEPTLTFLQGDSIAGPFEFKTNIFYEFPPKTDLFLETAASASAIIQVTFAIILSKKN